MLGKAAKLPILLYGSSYSCDDSRFHSVRGRMTGVLGDVSRCSGMPCGAGGKACRSMLGIAGGGVGSKGSGAHLAYR